MPNRIRVYDRIEDFRHPVARDHDVVLYSSAWRRLKGVTQVSPVTDGLSRNHDRLMHSLKVAQVGRRLAEHLIFAKGKELSSLVKPEVIEVAGMVHDLGHPPFGHVAEKEFQTILGDEHYRWKLAESFEGNAQTFRVVTRLSQKSTSEGGQTTHGMNLTFETLAACTKYPWGYQDAESVLGQEEYSRRSDYYDRKWGYYSTEKPVWDDVWEHVIRGGPFRSANAALMDLADDITYAVHDVQDYLRIGLIPLHEIGRGLTGQRNDEFEEFDVYATTALAIDPTIQTENVVEAKKWLADMPYPTKAFHDSRMDRELLHRWESAAVRTIQGEVFVADGVPQVPERVTVAIEYLKELTWYYVINHPALSASQQGQRRIIGDLHNWLCDWAAESFAKKGELNAKSKTSRNLRRLPGRFRDLLNEAPKNASSDERISRAAVDFISGLTDTEAVSLHHHLGGNGTNVGLASWL